MTCFIHNFGIYWARMFVIATSWADGIIFLKGNYREAQPNKICTPIQAQLHYKTSWPVCSFFSHAHSFSSSSITFFLLPHIYSVPMIWQRPFIFYQGLTAMCEPSCPLCLHQVFCPPRSNTPAFLKPGLEVTCGLQNKPVREAALCNQAQWRPVQSC